MEIFDASLPLDGTTPIYPGDFALRIEPHSQMWAGASSNSSIIHMGSHTGTHVDAPLHMLEDGAPVDSIPLDHLVGPCRVVNVLHTPSVGEADLRACDLEGVKRVLVRTRNSERPKSSDFLRDYAHLAGDGARYLASRGVLLVGVDYLSVDRFRSGDHPAHMAFMHGGVTILEGLDLAEIAPGDYLLVAAPLRLRGCDGAPARVFLIKDG